MAEERCIGLEDLQYGLNCEDQDNMGGITPSVIAFDWHDVVSWPDLPTKTGTDPMDFETAGSWKGDVTLKTGKKAVLIEFTEDTGLLNITDQGEVGGISFLYALTMVFAKMRRKVFGFENATKAGRMGFIVTDSNGERYLLGDRNRGAVRVAGDGSTTGTASADRNQSSVTFNFSCPRKLIYTGEVDHLLKVAP